VYEPRGAYQLIVRQLHEDGQGRLQMEFERLKKKLAAEGLFDPANKRPIPKVPSTVGFITSPTGAAAQDFLRILKRRGWWGRVILMPVRVQGGEAAREMVAMLEYAATLPFLDAVVIGRGGGSLEDLWPFNEEILARAVAACPLPIVSAVGHEIDFTLCDFAADLRAETPSAAAEVISSGFIECRDRLAAARDRLQEKVDLRLETAARELKLLHHRLQTVSPANRIENGYLRLDDLASRLHGCAKAALWEKKSRSSDLRSRFNQSSPSHRLNLAAASYSALRARFERLMSTELPVRREKMIQLGKRLRTLGPDSVLQRGFVLVRDENGVPLSRSKGISPGTRLINQFADGDLPVRTEE
jgi:exodeoxyribonuclease VII large subunit